MRGDLIQTYKIMNNKDDIDLHSLFILTNPNTRNNEGKLYKKKNMLVKTYVNFRFLTESLTHGITY